MRRRHLLWPASSDPREAERRSGQRVSSALAETECRGDRQTPSVLDGAAYRHRRSWSCVAIKGRQNFGNVDADWLRGISAFISLHFTCQRQIILIY